MATLRDSKGVYVIKAPEAILDYLFRWTRWLGAVSDTIASVQVTLDSEELTIENISHTDDVVTVWLSGGILGKTYRVHCLINTVGGRQDTRSLRIKMQLR